MSKFYLGDRVVVNGSFGTVTDPGTGVDCRISFDRVADSGVWFPCADVKLAPPPEMPFSPNADVVIQRSLPPKLETSDGSTASYYELPDCASELQHLISHRNMNAQIGEIFRACYRYGQVQHSPCLRDIKKIIFYATAELERLQKIEGAQHG